MTLIWQDPPRAATNAVFNDRVIYELHSQPHRWALIRTYKNTKRCKTDFTARPADIEIAIRYINSHTPEGRCELYARWVPGRRFD